ncbi:MAG: hypothetical protein QXZ68_06735 [Candidatus Bathyarchaeia archaeon]
MSVQLPAVIVEEKRPEIKTSLQITPETQLATYIDITTFNLPNEAMTDELVTFSLIGKVIASLPPDNPIAAMAIIYVGGPASTIKLTVNGKEYELSANEGVLLIDGTNPPVGYEMNAGCWMKLTDPGKYKLTAKTYYCHIGDNTLYLNPDASITKEIEILAPAPPAKEGAGFEQLTKMLTEQLLPVMMSMMMLMMMMSMMSGLMSSLKEAFKKE